MKPLTEITVEKAEKQGYIPLERDYLNTSVKDTKYFSLTPHPDPCKRKRGWEKVTYYLPRKYPPMVDSSNGKESLYVLSNPALPGLLKIGYTSKSPSIRAKEIGKSTGVPVPFHIEYVKRCVNGQQLERAVHTYLEEYRVNNRKEFFEISLDSARKTINSIYNQLFSNENT